MKRFIPLLLLLLFESSALAQVVAPGPVPTFLPPDLAMPGGKVYIKPNSIPKAKYGYTIPRLGVSCVGTAVDAYNCGSYSLAPSISFTGANSVGGGGAFRTNCGVSHYASDDPIVRPFQSGMTHLHLFFGNTTTDAQRDASKMADFGASTCPGGTLNRTGYWVPTLVYACPTGEVGCTASRNGEVIPASVNTIYYKTQGLDATRIASAVWPPVGFRMVGGDPNNTDLARTTAAFDCYAPGGHITRYQDHIPSSNEVAAAAAANSGDTCNDVDFFPGFPQCWDGVNLYLPPAVGGNSSAHVGSCSDPAYPVPLPNISYNVHFPIKSQADWSYIVLSSDHGPEYGNTQAGSTTTQVVLAASASATNSYYKYGYVSISGQRRQITAYVGATRTATLESALTSAPAAGVSYTARQAGGITGHADWANGWNHDANFMGWGHTLTDQIMRGCQTDVPRYGSFSTGSAVMDCHDNNVGSPGIYNVPYVSPGPSNTYYFLR